MLVRTIPSAILILLLSCVANNALGQEKKAEPAKGPPYAIDPAAPLEAKQEVVTEADNHTQFRVEFNGIKKDRVPAYLYIPKRKPDAPPGPAVLLQFGSGGNKTSEYIVAIGKQFALRGFVVMTIDSIGTGERRFKDKKSSDVLGMISTDRMMHYCSDYSRAVDYLATRKEVDQERIGYVGVSWGAITGITYVAHDPRIKAMGSMVGGGNFLGIYTPKTAEKALADGVKTSDPVVHVARIAPRPLLFINVTQDQLILKPWAESLHQCAGENSKVVWLECDHFFKGVDRAEVCNTVVDFMAKSLPALRKDER